MLQDRHRLRRGSKQYVRRAVLAWAEAAAWGLRRLGCPAVPDPWPACSATQDAVNALLQLYLVHLIDSGQHALLPLYACHLRADVRHEVFPLPALPLCTLHDVFTGLTAVGKHLSPQAILGTAMPAMKACTPLVKLTLLC